MTLQVIITGAVVIGWLALAALQRRLHPRQRNRAFWALTIIGIPVLGWLTLNSGPMAGVVGLVVGVVALLRAPRRRSVKRAIQPWD